MGKHAEAERLYLQSLKTRKTVLGDEHADTLAAMGKDLKKPNAYIDKAWISAAHQWELIIRTSLHPQTIIARDVLATVCLQQQSYWEAWWLFIGNSEAHEFKFGGNHVKTAESYRKLGFAYVAMGNNTRAKHYLRKCLSIQKNVLGPHHRDTLETQATLAFLKLLQGDVQGAAQLQMVVGYDPRESGVLGLDDID